MNPEQEKLVRDLVAAGECATPLEWSGRRFQNTGIVESAYDGKTVIAQVTYHRDLAFACAAANAREAIKAMLAERDAMREALVKCTGMFSAEGFCEPVEGFAQRPQALAGCIEEMAGCLDVKSRRLNEARARIAAVGADIRTYYLCANGMDAWECQRNGVIVGVVQSESDAKRWVIDGTLPKEPKCRTT